MPSQSIWGPATWLLFHTLAEKIHEDKFNDIGQQMIHFIRRISRYLPCPDCSNHATRFFAQVPPHLFKTKEDFKHVIFIMHNHVNKRKNKPTPKKADILPFYKNRRIINVYNNFIKTYNSKGNMKLLTDSFQRQILITEFKKWLMTNINAFR